MIRRFLPALLCARVDVIRDNDGCRFPSRWLGWYSKGQTGQPGDVCCLGGMRTFAYRKTGEAFSGGDADAVMISQTLQDFENLARFGDGAIFARP